MSEVEVTDGQQQGDAQVSEQATASAGQLLRAARQAQQISVHTLAAALKVPAHKLQALEDDRWDQLTDAVFTRSLALSVCRVLKVDPTPMLAQLPKAGAFKLSSNPEGINAPFKDKALRASTFSSHDAQSGSGVKLLGVVLVAAAVAAGLYFVPQWKQVPADAESEVAAAATSAETPEPMFMPTPALVSTALPEAPAGAQTPAAVAVVVPTLPADVAKPEVAQPVVKAQEAEAAPVPAAAPVPPAEAGRGLRIVASGQTWVQVRDMQDRIVMEKILQAGDEYVSNAGRPLQVVVGNADATRVEIDGAAFNVSAVARNNVARFEVK